MSYLRYLCLFAYSGVQHIFFVFVLCFAHHMLPVSLDCPFLIVPLIFSKVYLINTDTFCDLADISPFSRP